MLAVHDMFRHFLGNPTSITMMASIYINPQMRYSLSQMYDLIKNEKKFFIEELDYSYQ